YRSSDGGQTYTLVNTGKNYLGGQGWYDNIIWVDPTNSNTVIVGGIDLWRGTFDGTNLNLTKISQWQSAPSSAHADNHMIVESPQFNGTTNKTVYFGNDGGIYRTTDVYNVALTSLWTSLNNGLGITQFYGGAGNPTSGRIIGGTQDNGTLRYTGSTSPWNTPFGGDGGYCAADPTDTNYFYGEYVFLQIHRSTNGGSFSNYIYNGITDAGSGSTANFIAPFILDPNNPNTLLAGGARLWRSADVKAATPTWASIKDTVGSNISAIAVAKGNSDIIWVGHNNGDVYFTTNGTSDTPTWTRVDNGTTPLPNRFCERIVIDPTNSSRVYVTFGGFNTGNVWRTNDSGATWTNISSNLPAAPVYAFAVWRQNPSFLYAGTEVGIFASADGGLSWSTSNDGPTNCSVDDLFWMNNTLVAVTHGRGMFSIPLSGGLLSQTITFGALSSRTFGDVPFTVSATASSGLSVSFNSQTTPVCTVSGNTVSGYTVTLIAAGTCTIRASQAGDTTYLPATPVDQSFTVAKATPVITWNNPANISAGTPLSSTQLNATANVPGTFTYTPAAGTILNVGVNQLSVNFSPTDAANYNSATKTVQLTVLASPTAVSFSSATYSVSESNGNIPVIVNRTGDTSVPLTSVNYATSDGAGLAACSQANTGKASSRCDYATTVGTLQFLAGETSKTIFIPIVNDSYLEGPESFAITLSSPSGAALGTNSTATITILDDDSATGGNPIVDNSFFVRQQYIDFLGREPDSTGLKGWQNILNNCPQSGKDANGNFCDRIEVSAGFFRSPEFQDRGYFVFRFYPVALGRNPNYSEFMPDLAKVSGFLTDAQLEANKVAFVQEFISRPEFQNKYGSLTDSAFVDALLQSCGLPNHPSRDGWKAGLANNSLTRARVLRELAESAEVYQKFYNQSFVVMQYFGYLRRDPDILYLKWIDTMNTNGGDYRVMINGFMNSSEYFLRFGP
ncbi:MAG: DUF4214 domain-containing protein, partial [Acidobacteriota bacterium]|nr:DUF4214 domain-containing protein [Acidobacteriota bacterium]